MIRARPDFNLVNQFKIDIKAGRFWLKDWPGPLPSDLKKPHIGPVINTMQYLVFRDCYPNTKYFIYNTRINKSFVFDTSAVEKALEPFSNRYVKDFTLEGVPINEITKEHIDERLPKFKPCDSYPSLDPRASNLNYLILNFEKLDRDLEWEDILNKLVVPPVV